MFSGNDRISGRQAFRLLTFDLLGLGTLLVPTVLAKLSGRDGVFGIMIGVLAGFCFLRLIGTTIRQMRGNYLDWITEHFGGLGGWLIGLGYLIYFILLAGYTAYLFATLVLSSLLQEESYFLVLAAVLFIVWYGLLGGIEGRARAYEFLFWILLIPLLLMLFSAAKAVDTDYWMPIFSGSVRGIFSGGYYVFICFSLVFFVLFLSSYVEKKERLIRAGRLALLVVGVLHVILYFILVGTFGDNALATMEFPVVTLMSMVQIAGGFLKRTDALMFAVWFFTLYALLNSAVFYAGKVMLHLTGSWGRKQRGKAGEKIIPLIVLAAVFVLATVFYYKKQAGDSYEWFLWYVGTPFLVLVAVVSAIMAKKGMAKGSVGKNGAIKKAGAAGMMLLATFLFCGCGTAELEDKDFPIEIAVEGGIHFAEEWLNMEQNGNHVVDFNHLKVMIVSQEFLEDENSMEELLTLLEKKNDVPRNTYVVAAEDAKKLMDLKGESNESVGEYLEKLFENASKADKQVYPTLGMLYQERENQKQTLFIPYVGVYDDKPVVQAYYVWKRGSAAGKINNDTALLAFFTQNKMKEYSLSLKKENEIRLFAVHNDITFAKEEHKIIVNVSCSGEILYQDINKTYEKEELRKQAEQYMNRVAEYALSGQEFAQAVDVTNSFKKLGGYKRDDYLFYQQHEKEYENNLHIVYNLQIDWVNR